MSPPASDISRTLWPPGPTSKISRSSGYVWDKLDSVTETSVIAPGRPDTVMTDGYGFPPVGPPGTLIKMLVWLTKLAPNPGCRPNNTAPPNARSVRRSGPCRQQEKRRSVFTEIIMRHIPQPSSEGKRQRAGFDFVPRVDGHLKVLPLRPFTNQDRRDPAVRRRLMEQRLTVLPADCSQCPAWRRQC